MLTAASGCVDTEALEGKACDDEHPCPGKMTCRSGICQEPAAPLCDSDDDCPMGGRCFEEGGYCVSCLADGDCDIGVCHPQNHLCIGCIEDAHCARGVCLAQSHTCVDCRTDVDCYTGLCHVINHVCLGCKGHHQCRSGVCDLLTGVCLPSPGLNGEDVRGDADEDDW